MMGLDPVRRTECSLYALPLWGHTEEQPSEVILPALMLDVQPPRCGNSCLLCKSLVSGALTANPDKNHCSVGSTPPRELEK